MRHDCTLNNAGKYRNIVKHLWTSVIFRLREPIFEKCKSKIQKSIFSWKFQMTQDKPCRGMIGCHILENKSNASVNVLIFILEKKVFIFISTSTYIPKYHIFRNIKYMLSKRDLVNIKKNWKSTKIIKDIIGIWNTKMKVLP